MASQSRDVPSALLARGPSPRILIWGLHLALPILGLWLLFARPDLDVIWEDHLLHSLIVGASAGAAMLMALAVGRVAERLADARLTLVSIAFLASAASFFLHAVSTPAIVITGPNLNFVVSTPVGLTVASVFALASSLDLSTSTAARVVRVRRRLQVVVLVFTALWGVASFFPPLSVPPPPGVRVPLLALAVITAVIYGIAALRFYGIHRRRRGVMPLSLITAFALLAEAMLAIPLTPNWHASWWVWHILLALAYGFVVYSAQVQARREGSTTTLFQSISLEETLAQVRDEYRQALEGLVSTLDPKASPARQASTAAKVGARFELTEGQSAVLAQAAEAVAADRAQIDRLDALASIGRESTVQLDEGLLLERARATIEPVFPGVDFSVGLLSEGRLEFQGRRDDRAEAFGHEGAARPDVVDRAIAELRPAEDGAGAMALPLVVKGHPAGVLLVQRRDGARFAEREGALLEALGSQLSIALENVRLYRETESLFRSYMSPAVATSLLADPAQAALGGAVREVSVLFADLRGYTTFSERRDPAEVVEVLNAYFGAAVPLVLSEGGTVVQFVGDAVMAIWNAPAPQPDHALRAARTALGLQRVVEELARGEPGWPRFRVGVETGPALIGNIGSSEIREYTAIGDTTNLAARLQAMAAEGEVVVGPGAWAQIRDAADAEPLGTLEIRGRAAGVEAYRLLGLRGEAPAGSPGAPGSGGGAT